jgi:uncharacterized membrane protein
MLGWWWGGRSSVNMELYLQSLVGLHMHSCTYYLRPRNLTTTPRIWARMRGRYWSAKIDDIFFVIPLGRCFFTRADPSPPKLLDWINLKTTWTVFSHLRIFALCQAYTFLLLVITQLNWHEQGTYYTMEATVSKQRNSGHCMYIVYSVWF